MKYPALTVNALAAIILAGAAHGQSSGTQRSFSDIMTTPVQGGDVLLAPEPTLRRAPLPTTLFKGCEDGERPSGLSQNGASDPRDRIERAKTGAPASGGRVFADFEDGPDASDDTEDNCWNRLDGLWVARGARPAFDRDFQTDGWGEDANSPELNALTHSVYTVPDYLIVHVPAAPERGLQVQRPFGEDIPVTFLPLDPAKLAGMARTTPFARDYRSADGGRGLTVRTTSDGTVVLEVAEQQYVRPTPELPATERAAQAPMEDAFNREAVIQFLDSVRKGIDVTTQNPNRLANSDKATIFARPGSTDYYTQDRKLIPIDMALDLRSDQGAVSYSSLMSSATEIQKAYSSQYGFSAQIGLSGSSESRSSSGRQSSGRRSSKSKKRTVNLEASLGFGANFAQSQFSQLRRSNSVSQAVGFSRQKQFALIRNHAQTELDSYFRDSVMTAVRSGNFDRLIDTFGTHYPYATTFGSSGQVRHTTTREGFENVVGKSSESSYQGGGKFLIAEVNYNSSNSSQARSSYEQSTEFGTAFFDAVGGNGSWNESGFSAGSTAYPILMDMRPLDELLNPIHFPGRPDVYNAGRAALADAIDEYMAEAGRRMDRESLTPKIEPDQTWRIHSRWLRCTFPGDDIASISPGSPMPKAQLRGWIKLQSIQQPAGHEQTSAVYPFHAINGVTSEIACTNDKNGQGNIRKMRAHNDYLIVHGTVAEIRKYVFRYRAEIAEVDWALNPDDTINANSPNLLIPAKADSKVGDYYTRVWDLPHPSSKHARLHVNTRIERVK